MVLSLILTGLQAGVIRESKSSVAFSGFGNYTEKTVTKLSGLKQLKRSFSDFDTDNMFLGMASRFFIKNDDQSELIDLNTMKIYTIYHEEKEYTETPIHKLTEEDKQAIKGTIENNTSYVEENTEQTPNDAREDKSSLKLIRREFKVVDTGEKDEINGFDCKKYTLYYLSEWENTETGERSTDSLFAVVWTTPFSDDLKKIHEEEMGFGKAYMKAIGIDMSDMEDMRDDILGINWLSMFSQMGKNSVEAPDMESAYISKEMQKIEGYPIVIDGRYYVIAPQEEEPQEKEEEETTVDVTDMGSLFGAVAKQVVKSETEEPKEKKNEPVLNYRTELVRYEATDIPESELTVPPDYTKVDRE